MPDRVQHPLAAEPGTQLPGILERAEQPALVAMSDGLGNITFANGGFCGLLGYSAEELLGSSLKRLADAPPGPTLFEQAQLTLADNNVRRQLCCCLSKTGQPYWLDCTFVPQGDQEQGSGCVCVAYDASGYASIRQGAEEAATQSSLSKSRFLASVSHELRTPLNAVLGFTQILQLDAHIVEKQREVVDHIYSAGEHLLGIINQIIDYSKIEAGVIEIVDQEIYLPELMEEIAELLEAETRAKNINLGFTRDNCSLWADPLRLKQVLINLISNAIKYNREGGTVQVSWSEDQPVPGYTRISVSDTGVGIDRAELESLFQPFNRLGKETSHIEGIGVGLTIARTLAQAMGADMGVESEFGVGSTFWLDLPRTGSTAAIGREEDSSVSAQAAPRAEDQVSKAVSFRPLPILLLEPDTQGNTLMHSQLRHLGCVVESTSQAASVLSRISGNNYQLLIADGDNPGLDAWEVCQELRRRQSSLAVIIYGSETADHHRQRCLASGVDEYLENPVSIQGLQKSLCQCIEWTPVSAEQAAGLHEVDDTYFDIDIFRDYLGGSVSSQHKILSVLAQSLPASMSKLHEYNLNRDAEGSLFELHKLKSSAGGIGSKLMLKYGEELSHMVRNGHWQAAQQSLSRLRSITMRALYELNRALADADTREGAEANHSPDFNFGKLSFILVDDDSFVLDTLSSQLTLCSAGEIHPFTDAEKALEFLEQRSRPADFLFMDIHMPGKDGIWMMRELYNRGFSGKLVLISGEDVKLIRIAVDFAGELSLNLLGYLQKPIHIQTMAELIAGSLLPQPEPAADPHGMAEVFSIGPECMPDPDRLQLSYQPRLDFRSGAGVIAETRVSVFDAQDRPIDLQQFLLVVGDQPRAGQLMATTFNKAARQLSGWISANRSVTLALDITPWSLTSPDMPEILQRCVREHNLSPQQFILQVSESLVMDHSAQLLETLGHLRIMGFTLSISDFGKWDTSFSKLQRVPYREVKLSASYLAEGVVSDEARSILESTVELAGKLGIRSLASGVESAEILNLVRDINCDMAVGDYLLPAMSKEVFSAWLESSQ